MENEDQYPTSIQEVLTQFNKGSFKAEVVKDTEGEHGTEFLFTVKGKTIGLNTNDLPVDVRVLSFNATSAGGATTIEVRVYLKQR